MAHTENSGEGRVSSNSQSTYTAPNSLTAADIIEVLQTTLTSMGNQLHEHSKCQMEQVNKLTEAVNQMTSSHNTNKLVARSTDDPENSDNSGCGYGRSLRIVYGTFSLRMRISHAYFS